MAGRLRRETPPLTQSAVIIPPLSLAFVTRQLSPKPNLLTPNR